MIKAGVGLSREPSAERAARQAGELAMQGGRLRSADLVIAFATSHYSHEYPTLLPTLRSIAGTDNVVGCSGLGVLTSDGEIEGSISLSVMAVKGVKATPFLVAVNEEASEEFTENVLRATEPDAVPGATILLLADPLHVDVLSLVDALRERLKDVSIVGGGGSTMSIPSKTYQWMGDQITDRGVCGVVFSPQLESTVGVAQGCKPIGRPYVITKAHDNIVLEIGNLPAAEVLRQTLESLPPEDAEKASGSIFAGLAADERKYPLEQGDFLVRNLMGVDQRYNALIIAGRARVGQTIQFQLRDAQAARTHLTDTVGHLSEAATSNPPSFGLYFNCIGRGQGLYGVPNHDTGVVSELLPSTPVVGFFGNAQIGPVHSRNAAHNYSGVLALFNKREVSG